MKQQKLFIGQESEEDSPYQLTGRDLLRLLQHMLDYNLDKPIDVKVPMGYTTISAAGVSDNGQIRLCLSEEWQ